MVVAVSATLFVVVAPRPVEAVTPPVRPPVIDGDWADPELVADSEHARWLTFATNFTVFGFQFNVPAQSSADLVGWTFEGDALPTLPPWAAPGHTWAPAVAEIGGRWMLYFTARHAASGRQCIGVATASSAVGPYASSSPTPLVCQIDRGGSIDASPFLDVTDGQWWLHWKSDENAPGVVDPEVRLWAAPMSADGASLTSPGEPVLAAGPEEQNIEAPAMVAAAGAHWLFYASGDWSTSEYRGHWARCSGPAGPCTRLVDPADPFLGPGSGAVGAGAIEVARLTSDRWAMVFHGWRGAVGYPAGGYRALYLEPITFDGPGGQPRVRTDLPRAGPPPAATVRIASDVSVSGAGASRRLAWRRDDGAVVHVAAGGQPVSAGGVTALRPDIVSTPAGPVLAATGTDGATWVRVGNGPWRSLGGTTAHSPSIASWGPGRLDVMVTGSDAALWQRWSDDGGASWSAWASLGGRLTAAPDVAAWGPNRLNVVVRGSDDAVWQRAWLPGWTGWISLGGVAVGAPSTASPVAGHIDVVVGGTDAAVWTLRWSDGWSGWSSLGGVVGGEANIGGANGAASVVARDRSGRPWARDRPSPGAAFGAWVPAL